MKNLVQKRIALIVEAKEYSEKMSRGSVFVTDFKAVHLINQLIAEMQVMLSENLKLRSMRVYVPSKASDLIEKAKKELYLLKTAIKTDTEEKINNRIDSIRKILIEAGEAM